MSVPLQDRERGVAMLRRVERTARERGIEPEELRRVTRIHEAAMAVRNERADDDHEPAYLHPGRSALILLLDAEERDPVAVAAALVVDSQVPHWAPDPTDVADPEVSGVAEAIPPAGHEELAERLVVADERVRRVALAERLDHLRHAHLWTDVDARRRAHAEAVDVYAPLAVRTHPVLAHRYAWWCRMFGARHLG